MKSILKTLKKVYAVFERIAKWFWYIAGASIVVMAVVVAIGAVSRYVFRAPWARSYDLTCLFMLICAMLSLPYVQCQKENLRLDLFDNVFPAPVTKAITGILAPVLGLIFIVVLTKQSWLQATFARSIGEVTKGNYPFPSFPVKLTITVCAALLGVILLLQLLIFLFSIGQHETDGSAEE